ncbi:helix-turn-helix transcriptional regulator [Pontimicrobium sp. MEBiC01747]
MIHTHNFLKINRERTGLSLQDMASIIGYDTGNLSKIESGKLDANMKIALAYHLILKVPLEKLFKYQYPETIYDCMENAQRLKGELEKGYQTKTSAKRTMSLDIIVDRLEALHTQYANA